MNEPFCVQQEGDEGKEGGDETEDGEDAEPDHCEVLVLVREQDLLSTPVCLQIFNDKTGGNDDDDDCVVFHCFGTVWYFMVLGCIDIVEMILSDRRDTTKSMKQMGATAAGYLLYCCYKYMSF